MKPARIVYWPVGGLNFKEAYTALTAVARSSGFAVSPDITAERSRGRDIIPENSEGKLTPNQPARRLIRPTFHCITRARATFEV